jgi:hypothetical protein
MKLKFKLLAMSILACCIVYAQFFNKKQYPNNSFASPVKIPISLAGNFGECRPNHFHSGLDVRTNKVENIPIYSIADGYISRIKIEAGGFGNAIYITHANGFTSLYAHLNNFFPELETYVRRKQYEQQTWKIDLALLPHVFLIRKGEFIAYSGNTGSSQAPHLHMEIRDAKTDKPLNGLLFYNLPDSKAPLFKKLALYDAHKSIYDQSPKQLALSKKNNYYTPPTDTIVCNTNMLGLGIVADDPMENALGVLGVYEMNLYIDGQPHFAWQLDNIGYDDTRYMNAEADYKTKKNNGPWIQLCYKLPNDKLDIYKSFNNTLQGRIPLSTKAQLIKIVIKDVAGNTSTMQCYVKSNMSSTQASNYACTAGKPYKLNQSLIKYTWDANQLYDHLNINIAAKECNNPYSYIYQIHSGDVPLHDYFELLLKPKTTIPDALNTKVAIIKYGYGKDTDKKGKAATFSNGWYSTKVRELGNYEIVIDNTAPSLTCNLKPNSALIANKIICTSKDETTSINKFVGKLNGQWIRFAQKGNTYTYDVDKYCKPGNNILDLNSIDENGNTKQLSISFTR